MATDLITLEDYKVYKNISKIDQDDKITFLITSVSDLIKAYVGHSIIDNYNTPVVEDIVIPYDSNTLYLSAYPITEVLSVEETSGGWANGIDSTIHYPLVWNTDYIIDLNAGSLIRLGGGTWTRTVRVTYKYGYSTTPSQIKLAAIELVSYYLNEEWKPTRVIQGTTMVGPTAEKGGMPKYIQVMLSSFKEGI